MKKLNKTTYRIQEVFDACKIGVRDEQLNFRLHQVNSNSLQQIESDYLTNANRQELYTIEVNQHND